MSFNLPGKVFVVMRHDSEYDGPIAVYPDQQTAELHKEVANKEVLLVQNHAQTIETQKQEAWLDHDFLFDVGMTNGDVVEREPFYTVEDVDFVLHPDEFTDRIHQAVSNEPSRAQLEKKRLTEAAPDMLEALERVLGLMRGVGRPRLRQKRAVPDDLRYGSVLFQQIERLIKKAKGE